MTPPVANSGVRPPLLEFAARLSLDEIAAWDADDLRRRLDGGAARLAKAGSHYVIDSIAELPACIDDVEARLKRGEKP